MYRKKTKQQGFTIIELTMATAIFATILLVMTLGVMSFTRSYVKGANRTKTMETARQVIGEISQAVQFSSTLTPGAGAGGWQVYCVDNVRYSYRTNVRFDDSNPTTTHALVRSPLDGTCVPDTDFTTGTDTELLGNNMRLGSFSVSAGTDKTYYLATTILYGQDDLLSGSSCKRGAGSQYCAVASLSTMVQRRL